MITWAWGQNKVVDFDPDTDTIFVDWFHVGELQISETAAGVVIAIPGNNQTVTLAGVTLADLSPANFTVQDPDLGTAIFSLIGGETSGEAGYRRRHWRRHWRRHGRRYRRRQWRRHRRRHRR